MLSSSPQGERKQVRGKTPEIIFTLTPALSRWRERGKGRAYIFLVRG
jgi:hypothetical protein